MVLSSILFASVLGVLISVYMSKLIMVSYGLIPALCTGSMLSIIGFTLLLVSLKID